MPRSIRVGVLPVVATALAAAGCGNSSTPAAVGASAGGPVAVESGDKTCTVAKTELSAGKHTFAAKNTGGAITEVYVYGPGNRVVGEVENIGPGTSRELVVDLGPGRYEVACKPGMTGDGIRTAVTVTG